MNLRIEVLTVVQNGNTITNERPNHSVHDKLQRCLVMHTAYACSFTYRFVASLGRKTRLVVILEESTRVERAVLVRALRSLDSLNESRQVATSRRETVGKRVPVGIIKDGVNNLCTTFSNLLDK